MAMEIRNDYGNYTNSLYPEKSNVSEPITSEKTNTEKSSLTRKTAMDEFTYLSKKFKGYNFTVGSYVKGGNYGSTNTTNVIIAPQFLEKMANDSELEAEYMESIESMRELDRQFAMGQAAKGWQVIDRGWYIDKDGGISSWSVTRKDPKAKSLLQKMSETSNEIREKAAEKKKKQIEFEKKTEEIKKAEKTEAVEKEKSAKKLEAVVGSTVDLSV